MPTETHKDTRFIHQKSSSSTESKMFTLTYSNKEQKIRATKTLLTMWAIAAMCVLIPVAHFLLVPIFLIAGVLKARGLWNKHEDGLHADGYCPVCKNALIINLEKNADIPQWFDCPECGERLELNY